MAVFLVIVGAVLWMILAAGIFVWAMEAFEESTGRGIAGAVVGAMVFAAPLAIGFSWDGRDPHTNVLCLAGHERWVTTHRPTMLVGKMIVPGGDESEKRWVCDQWEDLSR